MVRAQPSASRSPISAREAAAVIDWRDHSDNSFHVMRDNPYHVSLMLGGMFGMKVTQDNRKQLKNIFEQMLNASAIQVKNSFKHILIYISIASNTDIYITNMVTQNSGKGLDQQLLNMHLWPLASQNLIVHDSYLCVSYQAIGHGFRPWPTKRLSSEDFNEGVVNNFVGSNGGQISLKSHPPCPVECRPKEHQDWTLC